MNVSKTVEVKVKMREAFTAIVEPMGTEEKIIFCQTLIETEPPFELASMLAVLTGLTVEEIRDTARQHARETLENLYN